MASVSVHALLHAACWQHCIARDNFGKLRSPPLLKFGVSLCCLKLLRWSTQLALNHPQSVRKSLLLTLQSTQARGKTQSLPGLLFALQQCEIWLDFESCADYDRNLCRTFQGVSANFQTSVPPQR